MQRLLDDKVLFSLAVCISLIVMIVSKSALGVLGLVAIIVIKMSLKDVLTHIEDAKELSEVERVTSLEREVRQLSNALTFKSMK
jgi:ABC-type siderophore export system fused ATPase/permease subunit